MIFNSISNQFDQLNQQAHKRRLRMLQMQKKYQPKAKLIKPNTKLYGVDQFARSRYQRQRQTSKSGIALLNEKVSGQTQQYLRNSSYQNNPYPNFDYGYIPAHNRKLGQSRYSTSSHKYPKHPDRPHYYMKHDKIVQNSKLNRSRSSENLKKYRNHYEDPFTLFNINQHQRIHSNQLAPRKTSTYQNACLKPILVQSLNSRPVSNIGSSNYSTSRFSNEVKVYDYNHKEIGNYYELNSDQLKTSSSYNSPFEITKHPQPINQKIIKTPTIQFLYDEKPSKISSNYISNRPPLQPVSPQKSIKFGSQKSIPRSQKKLFEMNTFNDHPQQQLDFSQYSEPEKPKPKTTLNYTAIVIGGVIFLAILLVIVQVML